MAEQGASSSIDIFVPDHSRGLMVDALVLRAALQGVPTRIISVPYDCYRRPQHENDGVLSLEGGGKAALFIESVFEHRNLFSYGRRILLPNPEWLFASESGQVSRVVTEFWHKSQLSMDRLSGLFPGSRHVRTGFTTPAVPPGELDFSRFAHFAGRGQRWRYTQALIDLWLERPQFPKLTLQAYQMDALNIPCWMRHGNLRLRMGYLKDTEYLAELAQHGVHLCTSQMEGFGHYINEARSLGALIVTVDAAPMNELIDPGCGILVPVERSAPRGCGLSSSVSPQALEQAIHAAIAMPPAVRRSLGSRARERYVREQEAFLACVRALV
ncbi:glycosyltransferase [Aestuariivirga sp.]|uniref:glycosyltransferase n=1 Tax=Aestuariivirga sp. TaxID=2650926 RepID=UPI003BAB9D8D